MVNEAVIKSTRHNRIETAAARSCVSGDLYLIYSVVKHSAVDADPGFVLWEEQQAFSRAVSFCRTPSFVFPV